MARAGKVRGQTPKVAKQEKKKNPKGRAMKRIKYNRRFVNVGELPAALCSKNTASKAHSHSQLGQATDRPTVCMQAHLLHNTVSQLLCKAACQQVSIFTHKTSAQHSSLSECLCIADFLGGKAAPGSWHWQNVMLSLLCCSLQLSDLARRGAQTATPPHRHLLHDKGTPGCQSGHFSRSSSSGAKSWWIKRLCDKSQHVS